MKSVFFKEAFESQPKDLAEFLRKNTKPLVLYGMGLVGQRAYKRLKSLGVTVDALADGNSDKHGMYIDGLKICSLDEIIKKYDDAVYCITVSKPQYMEGIIDALYKKGIVKNIVMYFSEAFNTNGYPFVIFGKSKYAESIVIKMKEEGIPIKGYAATISGKIMDEMGNVIGDVGELLKRDEKVNFLICDKQNEEEIRYVLEQHNILNGVYSAYTPTFGLFGLRKYEFLNSATRKILYPYLCCLNKFYYAFADDDSRTLFRKICAEFFKSKKKFSLEEYMKIHHLQNEWKNKDLKESNLEFAELSEKITEFLRFLIILERIIKKRYDEVKLNEGKQERIILSFK